MSVAVCVPSRGRPTALLHAIGGYARMARSPVEIVVALDDDDPTVPAKPTNVLPNGCALTWLVGPREDSLGEKYNRCARATTADVLLLGGDDGHPTTEGYGEIIEACAALFADGVGVVEVAEGSPGLPAGIAMTRGMFERLGYFMPPYFPTWFHETWIDEVAQYSGRLLKAPVTWTETGGRGKTMALKNVGFWAAFFDKTRPLREAEALRVVAGLEQPFRMAQLRAMAPAYRAYFEHRNSVLRDPARAAAVEQALSGGHINQAAHDRLMAQAAGMLGEMVAA